MSIDVAKFGKPVRSIRSVNLSVLYCNIMYSYYWYSVILIVVLVESTRALQTNKTMSVMEKLSSVPIDDIDFEDLIEAYEEFDAWEPRSSIRLRRKNPKLNYLTRLIVIVNANNDDDKTTCVNVMKKNFFLLHDQYNSGLVEYIEAQGFRTQLLVKSLLWGHNGAQNLTIKLIEQAKSEYDQALGMYQSLNSYRPNESMIIWLIEYINSYAVRTLAKFIFPKIDDKDIDFVSLKDMFTDEMRRLGYLVINGEYHYQNKDIDHL